MTMSACTSSLPLERDLYFAPTGTIAAYAEIAREGAS
jgi:hypothetical protein